MKKLSLLLAVAIAFPAFAAAESCSNVSIIDTQCSTKAKADPDSHTRACALACAKSGFGIVDKDGKYLKFDAKVLPVLYLIWSLKYGQIAGANPWSATGLEWTTQSPPLAENFLEVPIIDFEAYDYERITRRVGVAN